MDPFLDLIQLLRPSATLWRRIDAKGPWSVSFRKRNDLLFCYVVAGTCQLIRPSTPPLHLHAGDFVLIRTSTPFRITSDPSLKPLDSDKAFAKPETTALTLGSGTTHPVTLHGGRFLFDTANEDLLTSLLPPTVHVPARARGMRRIHTLLKMNAQESAAPGPGSTLIIARLMELILIELLRNTPLHLRAQSPGLLRGLADPITAPALRAMHARIAHAWTVAELAALVHVSRSAFAIRFRTTVGLGPIEYLNDWRMAIAKNDLRHATRSISEIAFAIGFHSVSAFSTAFSKRVGASPSAFAST